MALKIGATIRTFVQSGEPVVSQAYIDSIPPEDDIQEKIRLVLDNEINPGIAAHSGVINLLGIKNNSIWINMGGGCQGCAASSITLRQGVHQAFRQAEPTVGAIFDDTDHAAGENPFFASMPSAY